jgi:hypothetical protein
MEPWSFTESNGKPLEMQNLKFRYRYFLCAFRGRDLLNKLMHKLWQITWNLQFFPKPLFSFQLTVSFSSHVPLNVGIKNWYYLCAFTTHFIADFPYYPCGKCKSTSTFHFKGIEILPKQLYILCHMHSGM